MTMDVSLRGQILDGPHEARWEDEPPLPVPCWYFVYGDRGTLIYRQQTLEVPLLECLDVVLYGEDAQAQLAGLGRGDRVRVWGDLEIKRYSDDDATAPRIAVIARRVERDLGAERPESPPSGIHPAQPGVRSS